MSYTRTYTFTRTDARKIATKVSADLEYMQIFYDQPSDETITKYEDEVTELLAGGHLDNVTYGFKRGDIWTVALRYHARLDGTLADQGAGRITAIIGKDVAGATFYSYLIYSQKWIDLTPSEREQVQRSLPFKRTGAPEPSAGNGYWDTDRSYSSGGGGVSRSVLKSE